MRDLLDFETRFSEGETEGVFTGYASVFGIPDAFGDTVKPGAFRKTLAEHKRANSRPMMLWAHSPADIVGVWDSIEEDAKGLKVRGRLVRETAKGAEAYALLKAGALSGLSIGFRTRSSERGPNGSRVVTDMELVEISLVGNPAASKARITSVRSTSDANAIARALRDTARAMKGTDQ
jgi:HK97 family phage prohead protease